MPAGIHHVKLAAFFAGLGVFCAVETLRPLRPWDAPRSRRLAAHAAVAAFNTAVVRLLAAGPLLAWVACVHEHRWGLAYALGLSGPAGLAAALISFDCYDYGWHRLNHRAPFFWRFHRVHHLDTELDVTTSLRFHFGELLLSAAAKALWIAVWGPTAGTFAACEASVTLASQFHHANFDFSDAWEARLRPLVMTPRAHTAHHAVAPRTRDANYATVLSIWDRLFGSFEEPDPAESRSLGLPEGREDCLSARALLVSPFTYSR